MGNFNHGHIQWNSLESTGNEDQQFICLIQDSFLTQHVLEPTRGENVLDIVLSSQKELVDNVKIFTLFLRKAFKHFFKCLPCQPDKCLTELSDMSYLSNYTE